MDEALSGPATVREPLTVEEAEDMNPPVRVERPLARKVEEALRGPETVNEPLTVEDGAIKPPSKLARLATIREEEVFKLPRTWRLELTVEEAEEMKPVLKLDRPLKMLLPSAFRFVMLAVLMVEVVRVEVAMVVVLKVKLPSLAETGM